MKTVCTDWRWWCIILQKRTYMPKCFKWTLKIYWWLKTICLVLHIMPGGASQDMLLDDLFEDIYQIVMYLLWSQSVFNSNDECCVVYTVITAPCNSLLSFQFLSLLWQTEWPVSCQPNKPNFHPQSVLSGIQLYLTWQWGADVREPARRLLFCFPAFSSPAECGDQPGSRESRGSTSFQDMLGLTAALTSVAVWISGHWIKQQTCSVPEWCWWHAIFLFPISIVGNYSNKSVLIIIVTRHGLSSAPGERKSTALDKLKNKSRLHLKGTELGLRLSTSKFLLGKWVGFCSGFEMSFPRKGSSTTQGKPLFSLPVQETLLSVTGF